MLNPRCAILSTSSLLRVWAYSISPMYKGTGVSCEVLCLTKAAVSGARLCLTLLNSNWAIASAADNVSSAIWSLMLCPSRTMFTLDLVPLYSVCWSWLSLPVPSVCFCALCSLGMMNFSLHFFMVLSFVRNHGCFNTLALIQYFKWECWRQLAKFIELNQMLCKWTVSTSLVCSLGLQRTCQCLCLVFLAYNTELPVSLGCARSCTSLKLFDMFFKHCLCKFQILHLKKKYDMMTLRIFIPIMAAILKNVSFKLQFPGTIW